MPWRRKWQPSPVFLLGKFHGQRSLAGYQPWGHKKLDMIEPLTHTQTRFFITFTWLIRNKVWHCSAKYKDPNIRHCSSRGKWIGCGGHECIKFMIGIVHLMSLTWSCHVMPDAWLSIQPLLIPTDPVISPFTGKDIGAQVHTTLRFFFLMWTMFKVFIEFVTILFLFYVLVFWLQGMENLSSPSRDQTPTPCILRGTQPLDDQGSPSHNF